MFLIVDYMNVKKTFYLKGVIDQISREKTGLSVVTYYPLLRILCFSILPSAVISK